MNTAKIAALYADPIFNTLLRFPQYDPSTTLTEQVMAYVMREARVVSEDGRRYHLQASQLQSRSKYRNDLGLQAGGFLDEKCTKRQADWVLNQLPGWPEVEVDHLRNGLTKEETYQLSVWGYGQEEDDTLACLRLGALEDFTLLLRGVACIRRKRRRQARKLEAQLRAYHQRQEQQHLRQGIWLGADKALTTAARLNEPGIAYLGDAGLSAEQCKALGLAYWAVPEKSHMGLGFPAGTGLAMKRVKHTRGLVDGAVYVWTKKWPDGHSTTVLGRCDMTRKHRGLVPLMWDELPENNLMLWAAWQDESIKLYRVTHYTTRAAAPAALPARLAAETQPTRPQPVKRRQRRELALAA